MSDSDQQLVEKVHLALRQTPLRTRRNLRADSREGRVTLSGVVPSYYQKQLAQELVRRVDGVGQIDNQLEVCWA